MSVLHVLQHALGRDQYGRRNKGLTEDYRNRYVAGEGHHSFAFCREAVTDGLMVEHPPRVISGGDYTFCVTEKGKAYLSEHSPSPPKKTRGQRRYERFLNIKDAVPDLTFGEFLKREKEFT